MSFNPEKYIIKLKGKDYLEVKWRLVWFREDNDPKDPTSIAFSTEIIQDDGEQGLVKATAYDGNGRILATGLKREHKREFHDYIEKAETGALGRVLAILGYGTQFSAELDLPDGHMVDSPVDRKPNTSTPAPAKPNAATTPPPNARDVAKAKAEAAKAAREAGKTAEVANTPSTDSLPFDEQTAQASTPSTPAASVGEPINEGQLKAIASMMKMLTRKKEGFDEAGFLSGIASGFGRASLQELSFEQGKEVVVQINAEMRKQ